MQSDRFENSRSGQIKRCVKLSEDFGKARSFFRPDIGGHELSQWMPVSKLAPDMPKFLQIMQLGILGFFCAEGRITARPACAGNLIAQLLRIGQSEELFRQGLRLGNQISRNAMIADDAKTGACKALP